VAQHEDLSALTELPQAQVTATAESTPTSQGKQIYLHLENKSAILAFQISAAIRTPSGELIAPVIWSDNWVELAPGESRNLMATVSSSVTTDGQQIIQLSGWNITPQTITPTTKTAAR